MSSRFLKVTSLNASPIPLLVLGLLLAGCARNRDLDETGGLRITRSVCPAVAIPAYTGDVTLFSPAGSRDARALDVTATITNLRTNCNDQGSVVQASVNFDVVARRADAAGARDVVLPYFATVLRGGTRIMSKQVSQVQVHFDAGQVRGSGRAVAGAAVDKAAASLPPAISERLNRRRKSSDADASIDPTAAPDVRAALNRASFELLVGFQLNQDQLAYNATR